MTEYIFKLFGRTAVELSVMLLFWRVKQWRHTRLAIPFTLEKQYINVVDSAPFLEKIKIITPNLTDLKAVSQQVELRDLAQEWIKSNSAYFERKEFS